MLEEEDSLGLPAAVETAWTRDESANRLLRVAVLALPSFSNFTDFDSLRSEGSVSLLFCRTADAIALADVVILPGTKQTVDDLLWMRREGLDSVMKRYAETGLLVGVCGGMQMLGEAISDPLEMEHEGSVPGLGLLPICTIMKADKVTRNATGEMTASVLFGQPIADSRLSGYEIHIGETIYQADARPFANLMSRDGIDGSTATSNDGCISFDTRIFGTYLHGIFDEDSFRHEFLRSARAFHELTAPKELNCWKQLREDSLNRLALEVRRALDMKTIFRWVGLTYTATLSADCQPEHTRREEVK
jgi:adenosylcobyric acid synthase